jgi:presequence protease
MLSQDPIVYKGVVFNEMKGVYSQPDSMNGTITQQALFPDNSYAVDSGGNPSVIPDLTFEEFRVRACPRQLVQKSCGAPCLQHDRRHRVPLQDFHARYYHPSNARIWFYGDDPPEERLRILSTFLDEFEAREVRGQRSWQPSLP